MRLTPLAARNRGIRTRGGANKWTKAITGCDLDTGELRWAHLATEHDAWDGSARISA